MEHITTILSLACTIAGLLATAVTFIAKFIKSTKAKRIAEQTIRICDAVLPFIRQAENFKHYSGTEKKEFVMTKANQFCIEQKMPFNTELISSKIEELLKLTREVNRREKDIQETVPSIPPQKIIIGAR